MSGVESRRSHPPRDTRASTLQRLRRELLHAAPPSWGLRLTVPDDPTTAILDAWATVTDVLSFYADRLSDEGFVDSAREDGSVLGLLELTVVGPRPAVGSSVALAYLLHDSPHDQLVDLAAGLLSQTVPGPGEAVQTFETSESLRGRPSWSRLKLRTGRPVTALGGPGPYRLRVRGAATGVGAGNVLLWEQGGVGTALRVTGTQLDLAADTTALEAMPLASADPGDQDRAAAEPPRSVRAQVSDDWSAASVLGVLRGSETTIPRREVDVDGPRPLGWAAGFEPDSDAITQLVGALDRGQTYQLHALLATSRRAVPDGPPELSTFRVSAAPFGASAPPPPVVDAAGRLDPTADWPLGDVVDLRIVLTAPAGDLDALAAGDVTPGRESWLRTGIVRFLRDQLRRHRGLLSLFGVGPAVDEELSDLADRIQQRDLELERLRRAAAPAQGQPAEGQSGGDRSGAGSGPPPTLPTELVAAITVSAPGWPVQHRQSPLRQASAISLGPLGQLEVTLDGDDVVVRYDSGEIRGAGVEFRVSFAQDDESVTIGIDDLARIWYPAATRRLDTWFAARRLTLELDTVTDELVAVLQLPVPSREPAVLHLDRTYPDVVPGSRVVVTCADGAQLPGRVGYPLVTTVSAADEVALNRYGISARVTRLVLEDDWIDRASTLGAVRGLQVHAAPTVLSVLDDPIEDEVEGSRLELATVQQGLEVGRTLVLTGDLSRLPDGATATAGETVEIASVGVSADPGGLPYSVLTLREPLSGVYDRSSVTLYGNVVRAHQAATTTEVLGSGDSRTSRQQFTLAAAPLLWEPTSQGVVPTLVVHVGGRRYDEVRRLDETTPERSYACTLDGRGHTVLTFAAPLPTGSGNVVASYRAAFGAQGNVRAGQVSQLLSRPLPVAGVLNPLPASGGADPESTASVRRRAGTGLRALDHAVTLEDYQDLAAGWAGVGKARASAGHDDRGRAVVVVDVAGETPAPLQATSLLVVALRDRLLGPEPTVGVVVRAVEPLTMFVRLRVARDPEWTWTAVARAVQDALVGHLGYDARSIGQPVLLADLLLSAQSPPGVVAASVTGLALVPPSATPADLVALPDRLRQRVPPRTEVGGSQLAFVDADVPGSVLLEEEPW